MLKRGIGRLCLALFAVLAFAGSGGRASAGNFILGPGSDAVPDSNAAAYCSQVGGMPVRRLPVYGSNGSSLLFLDGERTFCQFTSPSDGSRINVLASTLYSTKPTLAALAYYAAPPLGGGCNGNPASCYCTQLGGSDLFGGATAAGGGWYHKGNIDETLEACILPDLSSIDSWGLAYHSDGIIRGIDLSTVLRYKNPFNKVPAPKGSANKLH